MSLRQIYRDGVGVVAIYEYIVQGNPKEWATPIEWIKCNIQPVKDGLTIQLIADYGVLRIADYNTLYCKNFPDFDFSEAPTEITESIINRGAKRVVYFFANNWHLELARENWTRGGRAVKHYKVMAKAGDGLSDYAPPPYSSINLPTPTIDLVDYFENEVNEIAQVANIIENNDL